MTKMLTFDEFRASFKNDEFDIFDENTFDERFYDIEFETNENNERVYAFYTHINESHDVDNLENEGFHVDDIDFVLYLSRDCRSTSLIDVQKFAYEYYAFFEYNVKDVFNNH